MGGRKKSSSVSYTPFQKLAIDISQTQPLRLDTFNEAVKSAINRQISNLQSQLADIQKQKLSGLEFALTSAIGTTQYNPYAGKITSAIERIGQEKTQPLMQTQQDILTQYGKIAPETAQLMKMAGAVKAVPSITKEDYRTQIQQQWGSALPKAEQFLADTTNLLKNLGATDEEIQQALSPFYQTMEAGQRSALSYAPYPMFGKTALLGLSKNNLDYGG